MGRDPDSWWLDERGHAGREHFDERHARRYDAKMAARPPTSSAAGRAPSSPSTCRRALDVHVWLLEPMIERAGFDLADASYSASGMFARYLCQKR